jgi:hypothetical protein
MRLSGALRGHMARVLCSARAGAVAVGRLSLVDQRVDLTVQNVAGR